MSSTRKRLLSLAFNLLLPGLGHFFWKEYLFGLFVFLVMLIAAVLLVITVFIKPSSIGLLALSTLPLLFYFFSFVDLYKTASLKLTKVPHSQKVIWIFLSVGLLYQLLSPSAPVNFCLRNSPELFRASSSSFSPLFHEGDWLKASRISYTVNLIFFERPILHTLPRRFDLIRFNDEQAISRVGVVIGLPNEEIEVVDGLLFVDGEPNFNQLPGNIELLGKCDLTASDRYSIIVATINLGTLDVVYQVSLGDVVGKVSKVV